MRVRMTERSGSGFALRRRGEEPAELSRLRRHVVLRQLEQALAPHAGHDGVLGGAWREALALIDGPDSRLVYEAFVAAALVGQVVEGTLEPAGVRDSLREAEAAGELSVTGIALRTLGHPALLALPLDTATEAAVALLQALAPVRKASLWLADPKIDAAGLQPGWRISPEQAQRALALEAAISESDLVSAPVECWRQPCAVLVCLPDPGRSGECRAVADCAAKLLGAAFERASLTEGNAERCTALLRSSERRLTRQAFDLHDGPLQDVALLAGELTTLRRALAAGRSPEDLLAPLDDIAGLVAFLDAELRDVATSTDAPAALRRPFDEAVASVVRTFTARSEIEPRIEVSGEFGQLSDSQRIALLRILQESLTNVRDHSGAANVRIAVHVRRSHTEAVVEDDGRGFDVERALTAAARRDRMGVLGMIERARLLGGRCDVRSRPGEGTRVAVTLSRWTPGMAVPRLPGAGATESAGAAAA